MRIKDANRKGDPPVTIKTIVGASIILILVLALFMLREIFPNNQFIMKYFNKGYLFVEILILIGIAWGIDAWIKHRNKRGKQE